MTTHLDIQPADLDDPRHRAEVIDLVDAYARDPMGGGTPLDPEVRRQLDACLGDTAELHVLVARRDRTPVGLAFCQRTFSTFRAAPRLNIHDLTVVPDARGAGVGRALLQAVDELAADMRCQAVTLEVSEVNTRAQRVYAAAGFKGLDPNDRTFFLVKPLSPGSE